MMRSSTDSRSGPATESRSRPAAQATARARRRATPRADGGSQEARRRAAVILDVLAGVYTPTEAALALSMSVPRYYAFEAKLLGALIGACENRPRGRGHNPEKELDLLRREVERLKQECSRKQALVRAVQRTIGVTLPERPALVRGRRRRRPVVRALKAAAALRAEPVDGFAAEPQS